MNFPVKRDGLVDWIKKTTPNHLLPRRNASQQQRQALT
jgi:hypothetical protein